MFNKLKDALQSLDISLDARAEERFEKYCETLIETNKVMNLTAIVDPQEIYLRHFADSVALLACFDFSGKKVIDVGTGAGFPGLPLKIACPDINLTLLDSLRKRVDFLQNTCDLLGLDANCIHARAEEAAMSADFRDCFDVVTSRAVASLPMLCELCLPFVKPGGVFLAMKSKDYLAELEASENAIKTLQARVERIWEYSIEGTDLAYCVVVIKKLANTPSKYPRRFAKIQKNPL
ncbi:MAG: 16S rRNA (guanine(527)-N(7))-methyltransferase RsmG [Clostridia bacterium]|nr:16S rRNA (guanine(527)-N(7))-methyltransferase RsmG [Clostridia bacterium]